MSGINTLHIAKSSLLANQAAIDVTGSNITNINTTGYVRQTPVFNSLGALDKGSTQFYLGVEIAKIDKAYDSFLEVQIVKQTQNYGYSDAEDDALGKVEMIFNDLSSSGIADLMNAFWSSWEDLSLNPDGDVERTALLSVSESLAFMFRSCSDNLHSAQNEVNGRLVDLVNQANDYMNEIAGLNDEIVNLHNDEGASNFRDKRTEALKGLAEIIDFHYFEDEKGSVNLFLSDGSPLVEGGRYWELNTEESVTNPSLSDIVFKDSPGESLNKIIGGGKLAGLVEVRDTKIGGYISKLDSLAGAFISEVNDLHSSGFDINRNSGGNFFEPAVSGNEASGMMVSAGIAADINLIAASRSVNGDGDNAQAIGAIKDQMVSIGGKTSSFSSYYASLVGEVGQDVSRARTSLEYNNNLLSRMNEKKESISGVSLDEEMVSLIKYQTGYNAAAKLFTAAEELIDTLFNMAS